MVANDIIRSEPSEAILLNPESYILILPDRYVGHPNILDSFSPDYRRGENTMNRDSSTNMLHKFAGKSFQTRYQYVDTCWDLMLLFSVQRSGGARNQIGRH